MNEDEAIMDSLREHVRAARWLTDKVQEGWATIPAQAHEMLRQSKVRDILRKCKAEVQKVDQVSEGRVPLVDLLGSAIGLGREVRARMASQGWMAFPPALPIGIEMERGAEALVALNAWHLISRRGKRTLREAIGERLGSVFALEDAFDVFAAGFYIGYAADQQQLGKWLASGFEAQG